ncbi:hypothetical protein SERLA73DRAFT_69994 [Serpula lacrymans var. lacrymans S7.3]|uniref:Uncharacterized protein n=2 Tax=Serpula lacrymans var. lacrymans TaxID=341189 RepID=F8PLK7_SERL3|nr:uncharacterized protein SERLADRAFT_434076 [Serpula lacrymans var. lacrymans S7.9]EGO02489.1 hypothetical protein SERLA73DRAFT_69994 [Serpula lacrymans var. lacrymans S7.3]EGO28205.1 hypothetical protein SERLADRAFT_434076 [Serpula lacrymans var. lacrymans S7.9]
MAVQNVQASPGMIAPPVLSKTDQGSLNAWSKKEYCAKNILGCMVSDLTLQQILHKDTVVEMWDLIHQENKNKTKLIQAELQDKLAALHCPKKGNMHTHIDKIRDMWEQLSAAGVYLTDKEKALNMLRSLSSTCAIFVSQLSVSAHMNGKSINPETLIVNLLQEYD